MCMCVCLEGRWGGSGSHSIVYNFGIGLNDVRYLVTSLDTRPCLKDIYKWPSACSCLLLMWCSDFKICHIYYFRWVFVKIFIPGITQCSKVFQSSHVN